MKRQNIALLTGLTMLLGAAPLTAFAQEAVPADVEPAVYEQLLTDNSFDKNGDGTITQEELLAANYLNLNLDDVTSLEFLKELPSLQMLYLRGGTFSDFSFLRECTQLRTLQLSNMPNVEDVSFIKDMNLTACYLNSLSQISDAQKLELLRFEEDVDGLVGYSELIGAFPIGLFNRDEVSLAIEDPGIAVFDSTSQSTVQVTADAIYGKSAGTTHYTLTINGEVVHTGTIHLSLDSPYETSRKDGIAAPEIAASVTTERGNSFVLRDGKLGFLKNGAFSVLREGVQAYAAGSVYNESGSLHSIEQVLFTDGTMEVDGMPVDAPEGKHFTAIGQGYCVTQDGTVYVLYDEKGTYHLHEVCSGFGSFSESSLYLFSDSGELILLELNFQDGKATTRQAFPTGIYNVISYHNDYFVDEDHVLWAVDRKVGSAPNIRRCAEDVVYVGYEHYNGGSTYGCIHIRSDGTAYQVGTTYKVTIYKPEEKQSPCRASGNFSYGSGAFLAGGSAILFGKSYHIDHEDTLYLQFEEQRRAIAGVERYITFDIDAASGKPNVYFLKTDNDIWCYSFAQDACFPIAQDTAPVRGDVNADGTFDIRDVVLLQKWLLAVPDVTLTDSAAGDLHADGQLDVFDLALMKRELILSL